MPATHQDHMRHHRACKGKAHASGIGKQLNGKNSPVSPSAKIIKITTSPQKQLKAKSIKDSPRRVSDQLTNTRKLSRNSTSSWDYSDSDSLNSSEPGLSSMDHHNNGLHDQMIRRIDRVLDDIDNAKSIYDEHHLKLSNGNNNNNNKNKSPLTRGSNYTSSMRRSQKKETWADTLRSGFIVDDKIKKMEEGWDDSNIVRPLRERKCHRITAEFEQRDPRDLDNLNRKNSLHRRNSSTGKVVKRTRGSSQAPLYDVIEWEELLEMALATRNGKRRWESHQRNGIGGGYLKDLEVLRSSVAPRNLEVLYPEQ